MLVRLRAISLLSSLKASSVIPNLVPLLNDANLAIRLRTLNALGSLKATAAWSQLLHILAQDPDSLFRAQIPYALVEIDPDNATPPLIKALNDPDWLVRIRAAFALGYLQANEAIPAILPLLHHPNSRLSSAAALALGALKAEEATPVLIKLLLEDPIEELRAAAAEALIALPLNATDIKQVISVLADRDPKIRKSGRILCESVYTDQIALPLEITYKATYSVDAGRWLAIYWGARDEQQVENTRILTTFLGSPSRIPKILTASKAKPILAVLNAVWTDDRSAYFKIDVAKNMVAIIDGIDDWAEDDVILLEAYLSKLKESKLSEIKAFVPQVEEKVSELKIVPSPLVRTLIALLLINILVVLIFLLSPGKRRSERWLPFLGYAITGLVGSTANYIPTLSNIHLIPWLFSVVLIGEIVLLLFLGLVNADVLRQIAHIEPFNRLVPLALRVPATRRRVFKHYVESLSSRLSREKSETNGEKYTALAAIITTNQQLDGISIDEPVRLIVESINGAFGKQSHVLIEGPGGLGKSALLRAVVEEAVKKYKLAVTNPLPILISKNGESIKNLIEQELGSALFLPEMLELHLESGDFFIVMDGISETGFPVDKVNDYLKSIAAENSPILLSSRPNSACSNLIRDQAAWMLVHPQPLNDRNLDSFVSHYGGTILKEPLRCACQIQRGDGKDAEYLPILVRLAVLLEKDGGRATSVADIFKQYFLQLYRNIILDGQRLAKLIEAANWCVGAYWVDGVRKRSYSGSALEQELLKAGVLIGDKSGFPNEIRFVHDSMQSYLTAYGLVHLPDYASLPPVDNHRTGSWNQATVLLRIASKMCFVDQEGSIFSWKGSELFQMYVASTPDEKKETLYKTIQGSLLEWADQFKDELKLSQVVKAIQPDGSEMRQEFEDIRRSFEKRLNKQRELLIMATNAFFNERRIPSHGHLLYRLYAAIAPVIGTLQETMKDNNSFQHEVQTEQNNKTDTDKILAEGISWNYPTVSISERGLSLVVIVF